MNWINNKMKICLLVVLGISLSSIGLAATGTFNISIKIITALAVAETQALSFPDTESSSSSQTVVVGAADANAAVLSITGEPSNLVNVSVDATATLTDGTNNITVDSFALGGDCAGGTATIDGATGIAADCRVGATANLSANQTAGDYAGSATLTVTYQ